MNSSHDECPTQPSLLLQLKNPTDSIAWSRFAELYTPLLLHWVGRLGIQEPDRSDIVQEVFVILLKKISAFDYNAQQTFRGWLRTVTLNKCRDFFRQNNRVTEAQVMENIEVAVTSEMDWLTQEEYRQHVSTAALRLMKLYFSETTWRACWGQVVEGKKASVLAEELGITENAVYLARGRVLSRLRSELNGLWD